jgi:methionyl aminopeptidase
MIILKLPEEIEKMRASNHIVAEILRILKEKVKPGITTDELDSYSEELVRKKGAQPAFKGYMGYPNSICI